MVRRTRQIRLKVLSVVGISMLALAHHKATSTNSVREVNALRSDVTAMQQEVQASRDSSMRAAEAAERAAAAAEASNRMFNKSLRK
ncbi:MAG: hypothetical protein KIT00_00600 [Rhodospirillales bacterium]|nr:hypothetical protein [Rhodospirillales bacterium]